MGPSSITRNGSIQIYQLLLTDVTILWRAVNYHLNNTLCLKIFLVQEALLL